MRVHTPAKHWLEVPRQSPKRHVPGRPRSLRSCNNGRLSAGIAASTFRPPGMACISRLRRLESRLALLTENSVPCVLCATDCLFYFPLKSPFILLGLNAVLCLSGDFCINFESPRTAGGFLSCFSKRLKATKRPARQERVVSWRAAGEVYI